MKTNHKTGHEAEKQAAQWLKEQGFEIVEINWKTPRCEIDIIAKKDNVIHFTEVKYRNSQQYGSGLDYITAKKLKQMAFAAENWVSANRWQGDYQLSALEASPRGFKLAEDLF